MILSLLNFIPVIGPLVTPIVNFFTKFIDDKTALQETEIKGSVEVIKATEEDWGVRLARDIVIWPWALWLGGYGWDTFVAIRWHWLQIGIADPPQAIAYIPYAVLVFLLGNIGLNMWKRNG